LERVLIPIPQEQFPELALKRGGNLSHRLGTDMIVTYVIEDDVFDRTFEQAMHVLSDQDKESFRTSMARSHEAKARKVVLKEVKRIVGEASCHFRVEQGAFEEVVLNAIREHMADMVMMEYDSYSIIKYKIMDRSPVPVWIERAGGPIKKIGLFCSNLSPNRRSPEFAISLKKAFNAKLDSFYITDPEGKQSDDGPHELMSIFKLRPLEVVEAKVDQFISERAHNDGYDLIILPRIRKRGYFHLRSNFAKRARCSVLLVN